jgi:hypothetical protein
MASKAALFTPAALAVPTALAAWPPWPAKVVLSPGCCRLAVVPPYPQLIRPSCGQVPVSHESL